METISASTMQAGMSDNNRTNVDHTHAVRTTRAASKCAWTQTHALDFSNIMHPAHHPMSAAEGPGYHKHVHMGAIHDALGEFYSLLVGKQTDLPAIKHASHCHAAHQLSSRRQQAGHAFIVRHA